MMIDLIGRPAMLEMLAEEGSELSHAALKLARKYRGENPTPKSEMECIGALTEEIAKIKAQKMIRWKHRMEADK